jgi:hypothetical protein
MPVGRYVEGNIITCVTANDIEALITNGKDPEGYYRTAYKAITLDETPDGPARPDMFPFLTGPGLGPDGAYKGRAAEVLGAWGKIGDTDEDDKFLGVVNHIDDQSFTTNVEVLDYQTPYIGRKPTSFSVRAGDVFSVMRDAIHDGVIAGDDIEQQDLLKLGPDGTFVPGADFGEHVAVAYTAAEKDQTFSAKILVQR